VNIRGVGRTVLTLGLALGAAACDDNPTSEGRDQGEFMYVNPVNATVEAGDTTVVIATVMNQYGTPTNEAVTAEPCDGKVTAVADPRRSDFESPETFLVMGHTLGFSCVVVRGGGLVDTATVRVVPADLLLVGDTVLQSGTLTPTTLSFLDITGQPVTGFGLQSVTLSTLDDVIAVVDPDGNITPRAPGTTGVVVTLNDTWGVVRADTLMIRVFAPEFGGTVVQSAGRGGQILTFTEDAIAFDENTKVQLVGHPDSVVYLDVSGNTVIAAIPFGTPAGTELEYAVINMGPGEASAVGTFTTTAASVETWVGNDDPATAPVVNVGEAFVGTLEEPRGSEDFYAVTVTEAGTYRLQVDWDDDSDIDVYVWNDDDTYIARETGDNPEVGTAELQPGTYYIDLYMWAGVSALTTYRVRFEKVEPGA
jgi:hypothetical protein